MSYAHAAGPVRVDLAAGTATREGADTFSPSIRSRRDQVTINGGAGRDRLAPSASLKAAPHRSGLLIDARSGRVTTKIETHIRFSSVISFDFVGSTETRLVWQGFHRSWREGRGWRPTVRSRAWA